jgi:D-alanine-D-alanine ligase-like ATP-grasp enzyme
LDFGAVDVIWNEKQQRAYVLEVNTAPGLEGQTVDDYARGIKENFLG